MMHPPSRRKIVKSLEKSGEKEINCFTVAFLHFSFSPSPTSLLQYMIWIPPELKRRRVVVVLLLIEVSTHTKYVYTTYRTSVVAKLATLPRQNFPGEKASSFSLATYDIVCKLFVPVSHVNSCKGVSSAVGTRSVIV